MIYAYNSFDKKRHCDPKDPEPIPDPGSGSKTFGNAGSGPVNNE